MLAGVSLNEVVARHSSRRSGLPLITLDRAQLQADVLWLCVPDGAIAQVTRRLVQRVAVRGLSLKGKSLSIPAEPLAPRC